MTVTSASVSTRALSRRFGDRVALSDVSVRVEAGQTYGLIGLNGAGKSTLIRAIVGLMPPSSGTVFVAGLDPWASDSNRVAAISRIGYVPDRPHVYGWMRVREALDFAGAAWKRIGGAGQGGGWNDGLAARLLKQYRLDPQQRCGKLSKGQGAKLSLLLALAHEPSILILDEPTDGLDPIARDEFLEQVLESTLDDQERSAGRTVLISSHALGDLQRLTDSVGILHQGRLVVQAPTAELLTDTKRLRVVLDPAAPAPATPRDAVCQRRQGREWTVTVSRGSEETARLLQSTSSVTAVTVEDLSLDEVFKDVVRGLEPAQERVPC